MREPVVTEKGMTFIIWPNMAEERAATSPGLMFRRISGRG
jgi:hypothetical protein